jgi:hypothetical protein
VSRYTASASSPATLSLAALPLMKVAKLRGCLRDEQPKLNQRQDAHPVAQLKGGRCSTAEFANLLGAAAAPAAGQLSASGLAPPMASALRSADTYVGCPACHPCGTPNFSLVSQTFGPRCGPAFDSRTWRFCRAGRCRSATQWTHN